MLFSRVVVSLTLLNGLDIVIATPQACQTHRNQWVTLAQIPAPRQEHSSVAINNTTIAIVGGVTPIGDSSHQSGLETTDLVQLYDIPSDTWRTVAPIPYKVNHPNVAAVNGKIYVLGGLVESQTPPEPQPDWVASGECYVYDPTTDTWEELEPMPRGTERGSALMGVYGEMIYVAGGMTFLIPDHQDSFTTVTAFNTTSSTWQRLPAHAANLPEGRQHGAGAVVGHTFYVIGGRWFEKQNVRGTVFKLDLHDQAEGWKISEGYMPVPRGGISGTVVGNQFYTFGGEANPNTINGVFNETEVFNVETEEWSRLKPMAVPVHGTSAVAVGQMVYIAGGGLQEDGLLVVEGGVEHWLQTTNHFSAYCV